MLLKVRDFLATKFAQDTDPSKTKIDKITCLPAPGRCCLLDGSFGEAERQQLSALCPKL